jgi:acyl-CoA thioester hydrolase
MSRIKLEVPKQFPFKTEIDIRIADINYGNHMGNDALLSILHEARIRFLNNYQCKELDMFGVSLIMSDVAIQYKSEAYHGDVLQIEITAYDFAVTSFDLFYYVTRKSDAKVIALAKTNMVCYNYTEKKMKDVPESFLNLFI